MIDLADEARRLKEMGIEAIVFDLDGTLYVNEPFGREVAGSFARYIADIKGLEPDVADELVRTTRSQITAQTGRETTLSMVCRELGGDIREAHRRLAAELHPELLLSRDDRVVELLRRLGERFALYLYTNNNRSLSGRIMDSLGIAGMFRRVITVEDGWRAKPDGEALTELLATLGTGPERCLFVGDRYDIDLRLPAERGCPVLLVKTVDELLYLNILRDEETQ
jgi:putative hydrolase of the HAD superfamily